MIGHALARRVLETKVRLVVLLLALAGGLTMLVTGLWGLGTLIGSTPAWLSPTPDVAGRGWGSAPDAGRVGVLSSVRA